MCTKKILVSCSIVSLQDTRVLYPCCKFCLSRSAEDSDSRSRCIKCGFTCDRHNVDYRYRLSVKVSRGRNIFGVTVFGGCLNSFFGITAGELQRFIDSEKPEGPQSVQQLLLKAVDDCFIGKTFVFGFKLSGLDAECCLLNEHASSLGCGHGSAQFVACQLISASGDFVGMTVFDYLQKLLQASSSPSSSASHKAVCQKDSVLDSFENTLPLCIRSNSQTSSAGLTQLWQPTSDVVLCVSTEETSGHSLPQLTVDDAECVLSQNVHRTLLEAKPEGPTRELCLGSQTSVDQGKSKNGAQYASEKRHTISTSQYFGTCNRPCSSPVLSSTLSSEADKLDLPVAHTTLVANETLNPMDTMSGGHQLKRSFSNYWSSQTLPERDASFFEKSSFSLSGQNASFVLENAPLSETLGSFVSIEPQISEQASTDVLKPSKWKTHEREQATPKKVDCVPRPLLNITNMIGKANERSHKRIHCKRRILCLSKPHVPSTPKVSPVPKDSSLDIKDIISNSLGHLQYHKKGKDVKEICHPVCPEIPSQSMKGQESTSGGHEDEYNCSDDLFYQSSVEISIPDITDRTVTDCKEVKKDCLMNRKISEHNVFSSVQFAPSLQSTPIAYPYHHHSYGQEYELKRRSSSPCSKRRITCTTGIRLRDNHSNARGHRAVKPELNRIHSSDFVFENIDFASENSAGPSEVQGGVEHQCEDFVLPTNTNEWSRDLFDN